MTYKASKVPLSNAIWSLGFDIWVTLISLLQVREDISAGNVHVTVIRHNITGMLIQSNFYFFFFDSIKIDVIDYLNDNISRENS